MREGERVNGWMVEYKLKYIKIIVPTSHPATVIFNECNYLGIIAMHCHQNPFMHIIAYIHTWAPIKSNHNKYSLHKSSLYTYTTLPPSIHPIHYYHTLSSPHTITIPSTPFPYIRHHIAHYHHTLSLHIIMDYVWRCMIIIMYHTTYP